MQLINARLPGTLGLYQIHLDIQQTIRVIQPMGSGFVDMPSNSPILDMEGDWVSLGGVDLQINGALGVPFPTLTVGHEDKLSDICQYLWQQGVDAFMPTIVTSSVETIHSALQTIRNFLDQQDFPEPQRYVTNTARILGVHLEGPFLNPEKRGAHPVEHILPLTVDEVKRVIGNYGDLVKLVTLAPEMDASGDAIAYLKQLGITVSLGHSQATAVQANQSFDQGVSMVTHAFNAMPGLHHREPGLLGAALVRPRVMCGFIADGQHISPTMLHLLLRTGEYDHGLFLVSDALAALGLPDGAYPWDNRTVTVTDGTAYLDDGTLAGTTLPLLAGVQNLVNWGLCDPEQAISLATSSPRRAIGQSGIALSQTGTLLRWHFQADGSPKLTWKRLIAP